MVRTAVPQAIGWRGLDEELLVTTVLQRAGVPLDNDLRALAYVFHYGPLYLLGLDHLDLGTAVLRMILAIQITLLCRALGF